MFMHKSKKGFTIVELVIVIAVIAILAAVLIPTFSNLVKKANQSADIQAARQMNTVLAAEGAVEKNNIFEVYEALAANGMTAKDYRPLTTDHYFFWDDVADRIVYTDKNYQVIFPTDFQKDAKANWISLTAVIPTKAPASFNKDSSTVTVKTGAELLYVVEAVADKKAKDDLEVTIPTAGVDMMGAAFDVKKLETSLTIKSEDPTKPAVIYNATAIEAAYMGDGKTASQKGQYNTSLFPSVEAGKTLTIENVVFENVNMKNTNSSNVGILAGNVAGTVIINNVTIKNSTIIGHRNVGALIGNINGATASATIGNVTLENVNVQTVGGRSGMLVGVMGKSNAGYGSLTVNGTITLDNCSYSIYKCEQNTEVGYGLTGKALKSWAIESTGKRGDDRVYIFDETSLMSKDDDTNAATNGYKGVMYNDPFSGKVTVR